MCMGVLFLGCFDSGNSRSCVIVYVISTKMSQSSEKILLSLDSELYAIGRAIATITFLDYSPCLDATILDFLMNADGELPGSVRYADESSLGIPSISMRPVG